MSVEYACRILALAAILVAISGCAPQEPRYRTEQRASLKCPAGHTLTCEAKKIGRIRHGTFARDNDRCGCVPDSGPILQTPVIPSTRQD